MQLRDYQEELSTEAQKLLTWLGICYLSMEVRTGKTLTALAAASKFGATNVLFVTKKKAMQSIIDDHNALQCRFSITVVNYESIHKHSGTHDLIVLDEAHCLGQFPTPAARTKNLKALCAGLPIIFLSGTPSPESYSQLYHQFWVSSRSPFKEWPSFYKWAAAGFVEVKKKYYFNRRINDYSCANQQRIEELTKMYFLSYTQQEAGFSQEIKEEVIYLRMQSSTYWLAEKLRKDRIHIGNSGQEILADTEVKLMNKMHQIFSGTVLDEKKEGIIFDRSKASFIKEFFAGKKIAIFYKFRAEAMMLIATFGYDNLTESPEEFNKNNHLIFYSQIQSGREGTNLSTADAIVMFNIDYSSVSYQQARARMQVKDRKKEALLYWIFAENGIESKIYQAVMNKQDYTLSYFKKDYNITRQPKTA